MKKSLLLSFCLLILGTALLAQPTLNLTAVRNFPGNFHTDVVGYEDPSTGKEYAIAGDFGGIAIFDVTDPFTPLLMSSIDTIHGFDARVYRNYVYTCSGGGTVPGEIIDITDPANPQIVGICPPAHNLWIAEDKGLLVAECDGMRIYDLNTNPLNPGLLFDSETGGCHDALIIENRLYDFHGGDGTKIWDITVPHNPQLLAHIIDPFVTYHHSGYPTADGNFLFIMDELASHPLPDITVWDISDLNNPTKVGEWADSTAIVHNFYIIGDYAYVSYYTAGVRIFDITDPPNLFPVAEYDTDTSMTGEVFGGSFGMWPFSNSGTIYANDMANGLFLFQFDPGTPSGIADDLLEASKHFTLNQNIPNPSTGSTQIGYELKEAGDMHLSLLDLAGREVRVLDEGFRSPGRYNHILNTQRLAPGMYFYRMELNGHVQTRRMAVVE